MKSGLFQQINHLAQYISRPDLVHLSGSPFKETKRQKALRDYCFKVYTVVKRLFAHLCMIRQLLRHFSICLHVNSNIDLSTASPSLSDSDLLVWEVFKHFSYTHGQKFCGGMERLGSKCFLFVLADGRSQEYVVQEGYSRVKSSPQWIQNWLLIISNSIQAMNYLDQMMRVGMKQYFIDILSGDEFCTNPNVKVISENCFDQVKDAIHT